MDSDIDRWEGIAMTESVCLMVAAVLGVEPISIEHMPYGHSSITYDVRLPDLSVIVRTNRDGTRLSKTEHNLSILRSIGLPVPQMLAIDLTQVAYPFAYQILEKFPGRDLGHELASMSPAQMTRLAEQVIGFQQRAGELPRGRGYGYTAIGEAGTHASWWDLIRPGDTKNETASETITSLRSQILTHVYAFESYFRGVEPVCFLDDLTTKNVIVENGEFRGIVDFDCVCYGDPLYWLGLAATVVVCDVGLEQLYYVRELIRIWQLTESQQKIVALYAAWISLGFVERFAANETMAWNTRMLQAISQWIAIVDAPTASGATR